MRISISNGNKYFFLLYGVILTLIQSHSEINISIESNDETADTPNEANLDSIVNGITLELNDITLELWGGDLTDTYEVGGDD